MPNADSRPHASPGGVSGGTVLPSSSGAGAMVAGGAVVLLVVAGTIFFVTRDSDEDAEATSSFDARPPENLPERSAPIPTETSAPPAASAPKAARSGPDSPAGKAAAALRAELDKRRLWSEVEVAEGETILTLRSGYCADETLRQVLASMKETLRGAELTGARCYARHGRLIFEESF